MCTESAKSLKQLSDPDLLRELSSLVARDRAMTAALLAHLAEVDARRLYVPVGYPSMHAYCVDELKFSEDEAYVRIRVSRAGRDIPVLLEALAAGRIYMTGAKLLAPHLTKDNAEELIAEATHRNRFEIERLIERRFGALPMSSLGDSLGTTGELVSKRVEFRRELEHLDSGGEPESVEVSVGSADGATPASRGEAGPIADSAHNASASGATGNPAVCFGPADDRIVLKVALDRATHEKLVYARQLLGHAVPSGDVGRVLDRALDVLIARLEKQKFAATTRPRRAKPKAATKPTAATKSTEAMKPTAAATDAHAGDRSRYIASPVKRFVWKRDGGRCTFVAASGRRCEARHRLEFHHIEPFATGGESTAEGVQLRCRPHNQYEAEQELGTEFMAAKRIAARRAAVERRNSVGIRAQPALATPG
jgi:hypothetical protein